MDIDRYSHRCRDMSGLMVPLEQDHPDPLFNSMVAGLSFGVEGFQEWYAGTSNHYRLLLTYQSPQLGQSFQTQLIRKLH